MEILREKGLVAYLYCNSLTEAARKVGVSLSTMQIWIEEGNWEEFRREHYDKVHKTNIEFINSTLVEKQAELAYFALERLQDTLNDLSEAAIGSVNDVWSAFEKGVSGIMKLLGSTDQKDNRKSDIPTIQLSAVGEKVYLQAIQNIPNEKDSENLQSNKEFDTSDGRKELDPIKCEIGVSEEHQIGSEE